MNGELSFKHTECSCLPITESSLNIPFSIPRFGFWSLVHESSQCANVSDYDITKAWVVLLRELYLVQHFAKTSK